MSNLETITNVTLPRIQQAVTDFIVPLQTMRQIRQDAFDELSASTKLVAKQLMGSTMLPREVLVELHGTAEIISNEAPYFGDNQGTLEKMAQELRATLGLIIHGECHDDRKPGVPRIL